MKKTALLGLSTLALIIPNMASAGEIYNALQGFKPIYDVNLRYEGVDQSDIAKKAEATTLRARVGFQTGKAYNTSLLAEGSFVTALNDSYNSTFNGKTNYPKVLDPEGAELNRLELDYTPSKDTKLTVGRQRIILDDARFVGNVGWRQDEQTFDAAKFDTKFGKAAVSATYLTRVNRVLADKADINGHGYLLNASYPFSDALKATAFGYVLDFANSSIPSTKAFAQAASTDTYGLRLNGTKKFGDYKVNYIGQFANQTDHKGNPNSFSVNEYMGEAGFNYKIFGLKGNYEVLESDHGKVGFLTPLGTNHAFQGWADAFDAAPGDAVAKKGIKDASVTGTVDIPVPAMKYFSKPKLLVSYHNFKTFYQTAHIGDELDASLAFGITPKLSGLVKYADFDKGDTGMPASVKKTWVQLSYKY